MVQDGRNKRTLLENKTQMKYFEKCQLFILIQYKIIHRHKILINVLFIKHLRDLVYYLPRDNQQTLF